jgi:hypothetical protein
VLGSVAGAGVLAGSWPTLLAAADRTGGGADLPVVPSRAALSAIPYRAGALARLLEAGREGVFVWRAGDFASRVRADTQQGIYVAPVEQDGSQGAWERLVEADVSTRWFGMNPWTDRDGAADATTPFDAAREIASLLGKAISIQPGYYLHEGGRGAARKRDLARSQRDGLDHPGAGLNCTVHVRGLRRGARYRSRRGL